ncbi:hypothetical protein [Streptomyces mirabilis]|uniref:hypothetical protein n=1 Tax=Streptomyces mirabilis TaxID=68239 RepID=UPI0036DAEBC6
MPTEPCPNAEFHGKPHRYCQYCDWMEAPPPQKPSVGRVVLVGCNPAYNNGSTVAPAIITRVWSDTCVNARVLPDSPGPSEQRTSITFVETAEELDGDELERQYHWTWPPRV